MADSALGPQYPVHSGRNDNGEITVGDVSLVEIAEKHGTPAYVVAPADIRQRAKEYKEAFASRYPNTEILAALKAFPCVAIAKVFAEEELSCLVASGGELAFALKGGVAPERIYLHGNAKSDQELKEALEAGVGTIILDNAHDVDRLAKMVKKTQDVTVRIVPDVNPDTHPHISTGQAETKFGFNLDDAQKIISRIRETKNLNLLGIQAHIGSQIRDVTSFAEEVEVVKELGDYDVYDLGGGLGVPYLPDDEPLDIDAYAEAITSTAKKVLGTGKRILVEPGRSLLANSTVTIYRVETIKENAGIQFVAVDGGMSDNLRPMLYDAAYHAEIVNKPGPGKPARLVGKHCETGDVIIKETALEQPAVGDIVVTPATGAYGHAMSNNYNQIPRPPVIFAENGGSREVVRRETYDDLFRREA